MKPYLFIPKLGVSPLQRVMDFQRDISGELGSERCHLSGHSLRETQTCQKALLVPCLNITELLVPGEFFIYLFTYFKAGGGSLLMEGADSVLTAPAGAAAAGVQ